MLDQYPDNRGARFLMFLCAFSFALSYLAVNLATNSLPFGSDVSAMFPRWLTIRRGQVICTVLSIAIVPWKLLTDAAAFLTFCEFNHLHRHRPSLTIRLQLVSGYGYWLAPIAACMSLDYYLIKKGNINTVDLFVGNPGSRYWFWKGLNPRACIVTVLALGPCLPSLAWSISPTSVNIPIGAQRMFYISFVVTYAMAAVFYWLSYIIFPEKNLEAPEKSYRFEQWADEIDESERLEAETGGRMEVQSEEQSKADYYEKDVEGEGAVSSYALPV